MKTVGDKLYCVWLDDDLRYVVSEVVVTKVGTKWYHVLDEFGNKKRVGKKDFGWLTRCGDHNNLYETREEADLYVSEKLMEMAESRETAKKRRAEVDEELFHDLLASGFYPNHVIKEGP